MTEINSIYKTVSVDMEKLFVSPEKNDTTKIAALLSKCLIPLNMGILNLPSKILSEIEKEGKDSESLLPNEAVDVYKLACKIKRRMSHRDIFVETDDMLDIFLFEALQSSKNLTNSFERALSVFCNEVDVVREQVSSQNSFFLAKTLGTEVEIDTNLIQIAVQNFIHSLNVIAAGLNGYKILALVKVINEIGEILDSELTLKFYSCTDKTSLVNKLGYRVMPGQMALNNQINSLMDLIFKLQESSDNRKEQLMEIFRLSDSVIKALKKELSTNTNMDRHDYSEKKSVVIEREKPYVPREEPEVFVEEVKEYLDLTGDKFERSLIGKNAFIKDNNESIVGQVVDILPGKVKTGSKRQYFRNTAPDSAIAQDRISADRIVIKSDEGQFYIFVNDNDYKSRVSVI